MFYPSRCYRRTGYCPGAARLVEVRQVAAQRGVQLEWPVPLHLPPPRAVAPVELPAAARQLALLQPAFARH
jgi:hypothetical protein